MLEGLRSYQTHQGKIFIKLLIFFFLHIVHDIVYIIYYNNTSLKVSTLELLIIYILKKAFYINCLHEAIFLYSFLKLLINYNL